MLEMFNLKKKLIKVLESVEVFKRHFVCPEKYIRKIFYKRVGYKLNLDNPTTYNEKLQWLKLYWHHPLLPTLVDKYAVKEYVSNLIGEQYIIPTLGVWDNVSDIDWDSLPNQFVLKCTHDCGGLVICPDKSKLDKKVAVCKLRKSLAQNYYYYGFEWPYKNVKPRIIAESYMHDSKQNDLPDYKFFCFNGKVKCFKIDFDRFISHKANYYDCEANLLPFGEEALPVDHTRFLNKPQNLDKMIVLAETLAKDFPFVRIDFYNIGGKIYFGEITFYPASGFGKFNPMEWDYTFGSWVNLPSERII